MPLATQPDHHPDELATVEQVLDHLGQLETDLQSVHQGMAKSHRLATLGTLTAIIAHEYHNLLTPIISYSQFALGKPDDPELARKALEKSLAAAQRAARISSSLLGLAREADQAHVAPLRQAIEDALGCMARDPKKDGIEVRAEVPDLMLAIAPVDLQQVLLNLLLNARNALGAVGGGRITVSARAGGRIAHIEVADNGPGVPEEVRDRLFEPFVTRPPAGGPAGRGPARQGTGLGLYVCHSLVRQAGGTIELSEGPPPGTACGAVFRITLPLADDVFKI